MFRNNVVFVQIALAAALPAPSARASAAVTAATVRKAAPGFSLNDSNGALIRLADYKGRVVLLNFWATWCHGCKLEIPWFMEYQTRYKKRGLAVIGVSMDEDGWKSVEPYLEKKPMNYPVVVGGQDVAKRYGLESMPMTLLIDRDGKIVASHTGVVDKAACENEIRMLLEDAASEPATK
jgi:cytochrome c biogenesis protein CcmG/thiol:disulfide interchange protein DsbE